MSDSNNSNSTEKLLNTIRGGTAQPVEKFSISNQRPQQATSLKSNIKQSLTAGVFIADKTVSLVLTGKRKQGADSELVKWSHVIIPDHLDIKSSGFPSFLKSAVAEFLGKHKKAAIWTAIDYNDLKLRHIIIPDLPETKIANAALWGLKKDFEVDEEKEIFDFKFIADTLINGIKKKKIIAFTGDKNQIFFLKQLFTTAGFPLTGITAIPFALQNFICTGLVSAEPSPIVMVNISRDHTEITCFSDKGILLTRNIRTGSYSLVEELINSPDNAFEESDDIARILSTQEDRTSPEFASIVHPASRLLGKVIRTGDYCSNNYIANIPVSKYFFFGETDNCQAFMDYAAVEIPSKVEKFLPFEDQSLSLDIKMPAGANERNKIIPALGMALSENAYTANFLYTFLQKNIKAKYKKINFIIVASGIACLIVCAGVLGWFKTIETKEINQKTTIERQLSQFNPRMTLEILTAKISQTQKKSESINRYARDFLSLAIINEICSLTPEKIFITSLDSDFKMDDSQKGVSAKRKTKDKNKFVTIKGIVKSNFTDLEATLTGYIIRLGDSPLFRDVLLENKEIEKKSEAATLLKFTIGMEIR